MKKSELINLCKISGLGYLITSGTVKVLIDGVYTPAKEVFKNKYDSNIKILMATDGKYSKNVGVKIIGKIDLHKKDKRKILIFNGYSDLIARDQNNRVQLIHHDYKNNVQPLEKWECRVVKKLRNKDIVVPVKRLEQGCVGQMLGRKYKVKSW